MMIKKIWDDERTIESIWFLDESCYSIEHGIEKIVPYQEDGQMSPVVWFAVYKKGKVIYRANAAHVQTIVYKDQK